MNFQELVKKVLRTNKKADLALLEKAHKFAENIYKGEKRYSGETLLEHCLSASYILASLNLDEKAIAACILHHVPHYSVSKEGFRRTFGEEIFSLVEGVQKMSNLKLIPEQGEINSADVRKVLLAATQDIRILFIKLSVKLHNMRTLEYLPELEERKRIAQEVLDIYAPLSYRLGVGKIKSELEDLAFRYTHEKEYNEILAKLNESYKEREYRIYEAKKEIEKALKQEGLNVEVHGRAKHIYSIYRKIVDRNYSLENMKDIAALRIVVDSIDDCYKALRIVHALWKPLPETFKDYIALPKENGYQSIHTVVIGPKEKLAEFQIRTKEMHEVAEEGVAVHYGYKGVVHGEEVDKKLSWLKQLVEQREQLSNEEFKDLLKINLFSDKIFVYTPKGKVIELPRGSTVLDFAYEIHSELGEKAIGANINSKYSSLKEELQNGDVVQIITSKTQHPGMEWLKMVRTYKARSRIKHYLKEHGKKIVATRSGSLREETKKELEQSIIVVEGMKEPLLKMAICCKPLPGNKILGFRTGEHRITIHREGCENLRKLREGPKKEVKARWIENIPSEVELIVEAYDRVGLLAEILNTVASQKINVTNARGKALAENKAECIFNVQIQNITTLTQLIERIKKIKDVRHISLGELKKIS